MRGATIKIVNNMKSQDFNSYHILTYIYTTYIILT